VKFKFTEERRYTVSKFLGLNSSWLFNTKCGAAIWVKKNWSCRGDICRRK